VFVHGEFFQASLTFVSGAKASLLCPSKWPSLQINDLNKKLALTNILAYFDEAALTKSKSLKY
jgi:hypothetical protein